MMAGETKPAPFLKQTKKKKDCFNRREASVIDSYFIHTFYPTPSIFRVKRWQSPVSSLPLLTPACPSSFSVPKSPRPTNPPISFGKKRPSGSTLSIQQACNTQVCLNPGFPHMPFIVLPVRLAWVVRAFAKHLWKWPLSHLWLTTFYKGRDRKTEGKRKSQHTKPTIQNAKYFIFFLNTATLIIAKQKFSRQQSLLQCTCLAWLYWVIFLLCLQKPTAAQWVTSLEGHLSPSTLWVPPPISCLLFYPQNL